MRLLILGANGQLGGELAVALSPLGEIHLATRDGRTASGRPARTADLTRPEQLVTAVREVRPDVVVNAAAYTAVDRAEAEPETAHRVNAEAPGVLAEEAIKAGALLVHYSTDYVFGEPPATKRPWRESDPTAPINTYGRTKLAGEEAIRASGSPHLILRTSWLYAGHGHNFLRTMLRLGAERDELRIVDDQIGSPTWVRPIAISTATILARLSVDAPAAEALGDRGGTYHLAAAGATTWRDYAIELFRAAHALGLLSREPKVVPVSTAEFAAPAPRPLYSVLDCEAMREKFGVLLPDWRQSLQVCLTEIASTR